ncbi:MAG: hypothetical protein ABI851_12190 [Saprospiraceae bacterium]
MAGYNNIAQALKNFKLDSPIPDEVRDVSKLQNWFRKVGYIPFAGTVQDSNHTILRYIQNLTRLSPTLSSCINGIRFYSFSGKPTIVKSDDSEFDFTDNLKGEEVLQEVKGAIIDKLSLIDKGNQSWNRLAINLYNSYKGSGNAFLSVTITDVLGVKKIKLKLHPTETVLYKIPELFVSDQVDVSNSWDNQYLKKFPPTTYSVFPHYDESKDEIKTMIHLKNGSGHYGRPDWFACSMDAFLEIKNKEYLLKAVYSNFTGQVLVEFEGMDSKPVLDNSKAVQDGWKSAADQWAGNFTYNGGSKQLDRPQSILVTERPFGTSPVFVHEFNVQTKEKYFEGIGSICERNIIKANMWSKNLSGVDNAGGFSSDSFVSELKTKIPLFEHYQNLIDNEAINKALDFIGQILQDDDYINYNIIHKNPFQTILKHLDAKPNTNTI